MRALIAAALLAVATPVIADETTGTIRSVDTVRNIVTMADRTVWMLPKDAILPDGAAPGDRIRVLYTSEADNGWKKIVRIERVAG